MPPPPPPPCNGCNPYDLHSCDSCPDPYEDAPGAGTWISESVPGGVCTPFIQDANTCYYCDTNGTLSCWKPAPCHCSDFGYTEDPDLQDSCQSKDLEFVVMGRPICLQGTRTEVTCYACIQRYS